MVKSYKLFIFIYGEKLSLNLNFSLSTTEFGEN
jgi:hypothetical protein